MSDATVAADVGRPSSVKLFFKRAFGFWKGPQRASAWLWTAGALALVFASLTVAVGVNQWNKAFFDALEKKDATALVPLIVTIVALVAVGAGCGVALVRCRMTLQVKWRQWLTDELLGRWLSEQRYYRLAVTG